MAIAAPVHALERVGDAFRYDTITFQCYEVLGSSVSA